jgi:hypothetical protein
MLACAFRIPEGHDVTLLALGGLLVEIAAKSD